MIVRSLRGQLVARTARRVQLGRDNHHFIPLATTLKIFTMSYTSSASSDITHPLLTAFRAQKPALGAWLMLPGVLHARFVSQASEHLDWVLIDSEHGLTNLQNAAESILAIETASKGGKGPTPLVRIAATGRDVEQGSSWQIKYALDAGARGVMVPMVSTESQAKAVARLARFPTVGSVSASPDGTSGIRGFGSPVPQSLWNISAGDYFAAADKEIVVIVQIETREAVENIDAIAAVDGIDVLFIGPFDLSLSFSRPTPNPDPDPEIEEIIQKIKKVGQMAGKKCAIFCTSGEQAAKRREEGWDMINVTIDYIALQESISRNLSIAAGK